MNSRFTTQDAAPKAPKHELLFASLFHSGRGIAVPCDPNGKVDLNRLTERMRNAYFGARALVGREYAYPTIHRTH